MGDIDIAKHLAKHIAKRPVLCIKHKLPELGVLPGQWCSVCTKTDCKYWMPADLQYNRHLIFDLVEETII